MALRFCLLACGLALGAAPAAHAQLAEGGARALALGRAATALDGEVWGHFNPAAWATLEGPSAGLFASRAFGLSETTLAGGAVAYPTPVATLAATGRTYGFSDYRETALGLGAARAFPLGGGRVLHAGLHLRYHSVSIPGFGAGGSLGLSAGVQVQATTTLRAGLYAHNVNRPSTDEGDLMRPLSTAPALAVGLAYRPSERALILLDAEKDLDFPLQVRAGVEVRPVDVLALRVGAASSPARLSAGIGVRTGLLRADVGVERHETLGLTPAVSLGVDF